MRTTVDLPEDIHELARHLAHDQRRSLSQVLTELIRNGLAATHDDAGVPTARTGMPTISVGRVVTPEDVRSLEDD